jgi:hypothetical protein
MAVRRNSLFLYLALTCFVGIILIFVFDGYMGVYDSLSITSGEFTQTIEPDRWPENEKYAYYSSVDVWQGGKVSFVYEVQNRTFSSYSTEVEVTVSHEQEQIAVLLSESFAVDSFDERQMEFVLDAADFVPAELDENQRYDLSVLIRRGDIQRHVIVYVRGDSLISKPVIIEPRPVD